VTVSPSPALPGGTLTYNVGVANSGPQHATGVVLTVQLDPWLSFHSGSPSCTASGQTVTCQLGDLPANGTVALPSASSGSDTGVRPGRTAVPPLGSVASSASVPAQIVTGVGVNASGTLSSTFTATAAQNDPDPASATTTTATALAPAVPSLPQTVLLLLGLMLSAGGWWLLRRREGGSA
jgi:uncharacterized repeat protein (TIGR01451 family)/LPXTG-motif cell wall-anchored protein